MGLTHDRVTELESLIAETIGCEPWEVIVLKKSLKNPAYLAPGSLDPEAVHVISREQRPRTLDQFDELVNAKLPTTERLHVIGPFDRAEGLSKAEREPVAPAPARSAEEHQPDPTDGEDGAAHYPAVDLLVEKDQRQGKAEER